MNQPDNLTGPHIPAITTTDGVDGTVAVEVVIAAAKNDPDRAAAIAERRAGIDDFITRNGPSPRRSA